MEVRTYMARVCTNLVPTLVSEAGLNRPIVSRINMQMGHGIGGINSDFIVFISRHIFFS